MLLVETPQQKASRVYGPFLEAYVHTHFITPWRRGLNEQYSGNPYPYAWGATAEFLTCIAALPYDAAQLEVARNWVRKNISKTASTTISGAEFRMFANKPGIVTLIIVGPVANGKLSPVTEH